LNVGSTPLPEWESWVTHPAVFLREANKGDRTWQRTGMEVRPGKTIAPPPRLFFVSVAAKGLNCTVSFLFATLAGRSISVAAKGFKAIVGSITPTGSGQVGGQWSVGRKSGNTDWREVRPFRPGRNLRSRLRVNGRGRHSRYTKEDSMPVSTCQVKSIE